MGADGKEEACAAGLGSGICHGMGPSLTIPLPSRAASPARPDQAVSSERPIW